MRVTELLLTPPNGLPSLSRVSCCLYTSSDGELTAYRDSWKYHSLGHTVEPKCGSFQGAEIHTGAPTAASLLGATGQERHPSRRAAGHAAC